MSFKIYDNDNAIFLLLNGQTLASIDKDDVEDFTTDFDSKNGLIKFDTLSNKSITFSIPNGHQFDLALIKLIDITDRMGI